MIHIIPTDTCFGIACPISEIKEYNKIYKIKKRDLNKPLAVLVSDFKWLKDNTDLNLEQIDFLKKYKKPFTILTNSDHLKVWINYVDEENNLEFINRDIYKKFAFRVANTPELKKIVKQNGPMFLTSANLSSKPEIYDSKEIEKEFEYYLEKGIIKLTGKNITKLEKNSPSDIFGFIGESIKIEYLRKN